MSYKTILLNKESVVGYQHILRILNHYYSTMGKEIHGVKESIPKISPDLVLIQVERITEFEFKILAGIKAPGQADEDFLNDPRPCDEWIHIDGIAEERINKKEDPSHPIHSIQCLTDLYENSLVAVK